MSIDAVGMLASDRAKSVDDGLGDSTACSHEVVGGDVKVMSCSDDMPVGRMAEEANSTEELASVDDSFCVSAVGGLAFVEGVLALPMLP